MNITDVEQLRQILRARLTELLPSGQPWTMLDFPNHCNCGDSAIWLGQYQAAEWLDSEVVTVLDRVTHRQDRIAADSLIVLPGGGAFGGLYESHHALRLRVLAENRRRHVVQLPQSVEFKSAEHRLELQRAIAAHGNYLLMVRDERSYERARAAFDCDVQLVPDMAFALGPLERPRPRVRLAGQYRADGESPGAGDSGATAVGIAGLTGSDWLVSDPSQARHRAYQKVILRGRVLRKFSMLPTGNSWQRATRRLAEDNMTAAVELLGAGELLVTDRLHGHVIASLLGVEHIAVNDRYGKVEALWSTWTSGLGWGTLARDWAHAQELVDARLGDSDTTVTGSGPTGSG